MGCDGARYGELLYSSLPNEEPTQAYETMNTHSAWMYPTNAWSHGNYWHATTPIASPSFAGHLYQSELPSFQQPQLYGPVCHAAEQGCFQELSYIKPFETTSYHPTLDRVLYQAPLDTYATMMFNKAAETQTLGPRNSPYESSLPSPSETISKEELHHAIFSPLVPRELLKEVSAGSQPDARTTGSQSYHTKRSRIGCNARLKRAYATLKPRKSACPRPEPTSGLLSIKDLDIPSESASQEERDQFLVRAKNQGMAYSDIKRFGRFREAVSTLRGRFRTLTKKKEARVRQPQWSQTDVSYQLRQLL